MKKEKLSIQEIDWWNHLERRNRGFLNRRHERHFLHPRRKHNCRKLTLARIKMRMEG